MRPSRETIRSSGQTYFVTSQTVQQKPFFRHERWAVLMQEVLEHYRGKSYQLHAYVIMPDDNPVNGHLCERPEAYPYLSLSLDPIPQRLKPISLAKVDGGAEAPPLQMHKDGNAESSALKVQLTVSSGGEIDASNSEATKNEVDPRPA